MNLKAGAGQAVIKYTEAMLPNFGENYTCIHDDSYVQVLYVECGEPIALVAAGVVNAGEPDVIRDRVAEELGIDAGSVAVYSKHVLSGPHADRRGGPEHLKERAGHQGKELTDEEAQVYFERNGMMCDAQLEAAIEAAREAKAAVKDAVIRFATGQTDVCCNRLVRTANGWWQGHNVDIQADGTLPVLRFDDSEGKPIAILFGCNTAPGALENSFLSDGGRAISGDMAAEAERRIEAQYGPGTVAIYGIGCTGDQWQSLRALQDEIDKDGNQIITDLHEAGFVLVDILASRLAEAVIRASERSEVQEAGQAGIYRYDFTYEGQRIKDGGMRTPPRPKLTLEYEKHGTEDIGVNIISLGDTAIVMTGVELGSRSWKKIRENSPYKNTMIIEFTEGLGGGYLLEADYYDMVTYQSQKSRYFAGTAEKYSDDIIKALEDIWSNRR